ncbi:MAG: CDP-alcohol phosphatidyltransferase family protein [Acidimicrobiia bacterium]
MLDKGLRSTVEKNLRPVGASIRKRGITADHLTALGLVMAVFASFAIAQGALRAGLLLLVCATVPDVLDGAVAKASGTAGPRGAFFDSVSDRVADSLLLGGVAWHLASRHDGRIAVLPLAVLALSMLISYERAKAEALGFDARGGLMERAERIIALAIGLLFSNLLVAILWVMLALTAVTAVQRFASVWKQASVPRRPSPAPSSRLRSARPARSRGRRDRWEDLRSARPRRR